MSGYITKAPYVEPPYSELVERRVFPPEVTAERHKRSLDFYAELRGIDISAITYDSDGLKITGMEVLPRLKPNEKVPLVVFNRGGNGEFGALTVGAAMGYMVPFAKHMRAGVLASNYRGNAGSEGKEEWGGKDVGDIKKLVELGKQQPWWDGKNIFMLGWSRGGMMTYKYMRDYPNDITAAVVGAGVSDVAFGLTSRPEMEKVCEQWIPDYANNKEEAMRDRSAVYWPEKMNAPLLILHGDADWRVNVEEARRLYGLLREHKKPVKYVEYAGGDHGLSQHRHEMIKETLDWFDAHKHPDVSPLKS